MRGFQSARRLCLVAFAAALMAAVLFVGSGCHGDTGLFFAVPNMDVSAAPGQTVSMLVKYKSNPGGGCAFPDYKDVDAGPVNWSVEGPAPSHVSSPSGGGSATWTAPDRAGTYYIKASSSSKGSTTLRVKVAAKGKPEEMSQEKPAAPANPPVKILDTGNAYGIRQGGTAPSFTLDKPATITNLTTYHFIDGGGPAPGTLSVKSADGKVFGPWQATGLDGQGAVKNAFWETKPMEKVPAGTYTVVDTDPGTWSTNDKAGGVGFTTLWVAYE
jgi:hypothetical protein